MNKTAIKNYAIWARVQLIEGVKQRAYEYEITEDGENKLNVDTVGGRLLSNEEKEQRRQLIEQIRQKGYDQVMEEAAYTWFNRFIALRFMEVNGYLPSRVRVFTDETGAFRPEILKQATSVELEGLDRNKVLDLLDKQNNEELYKYLIISQCNALNVGLPYMFEKIANWTELLFPANLLRNDSVIGRMVSDIPEEDWTDAVQIIGWLYQYYNSELKDETFALLKKNVKITKERIPAATQLFTPDWIVRYMVENSLGRLWYEGHSDFDKSQWKYYLDEAEQEPEVEEQLKKIRAEYSQIRPEDIKVIDPCMGSGHILVYAFDVLMQIYTSVGWSERDAAKSILENNLYGLDIDDRAGQLAYFAVMMKARKHSRRILNGEVTPNVLSILDSNWMTDEFISYVAGKDANMKADLVMLRKTFKDAKEYGSILNVPSMQYDALYERIDIISRSYAEDLFQAQYKAMVVEQLLPLVKQSQFLSQKYNVVVTNPPYMGNGNMSATLSSFVKDFYPNSKTDLFACFMERAYSLLRNNGFSALITMENWMYLSSFEVLRSKINSSQTIINMVHMPYLGRGGTSLGINFGTAAVVMTDTKIKNYSAQYEYTVYYECDPDGVPVKFPTINDRWKTAKQEDFSQITGAPLAYYAGDAVFKCFKNFAKISDVAIPASGTSTGDNEKYLRLWHEVPISKLEFGAKNKNDTHGKWFPCNKGGAYRKWSGGTDYIIDWENDGERIKSEPKAFLRNASKVFMPGLTWSKLGSGNFSIRSFDAGFVCESIGCALFEKTADLDLILALLNSNVASIMLDLINPTLGRQPGYIGAVPYHVPKEQEEEIKALVRNNVELSKRDWNSFETSWDFKKHPLI